MNFTLVPADLTVPTTTAAFHSEDTLIATTDEHGNIKIEHVVNRDIDVQNYASIYGHLELSCALSNRFVRFPVYVVDGHLLQSVNQSSIVGELFNAKEGTIITVRRTTNTLKGEDMLFIDGLSMTFAAKHAALVLRDLNDRLVHTFCTGSATL